LHYPTLNSSLFIILITEIITNNMANVVYVHSMAAAAAAAEGERKGSECKNQFS